MREAEQWADIEDNNIKQLIIKLYNDFDDYDKKEKYYNLMAIIRDLKEGDKITITNGIYEVIKRQYGNDNRRTKTEKEKQYEKENIYVCNTFTL